MKNETQVEDFIIEEANKQGIKCYKIQGKRPSDDGIPDLLLINRGKEVFFLEVKLNTKLRAGQKLFLDVTRDSGLAEWYKGEVMVHIDKCSNPLRIFLEWFKQY